MSDLGMSEEYLRLTRSLVMLRAMETTLETLPFVTAPILTLLTQTSAVITLYEVRVERAERCLELE